MRKVPDKSKQGHPTEHLPRTPQNSRTRKTRAIPETGTDQRRQQRHSNCVQWGALADIQEGKEQCWKINKITIKCSIQFSRSVMSDSLWPHGLQHARLLCPWDSLGKNTGVGCHFLLQGVFLTQGLNPAFLHYRQILTVWATKEALRKTNCPLWGVFHLFTDWEGFFLPPASLHSFLFLSVLVFMFFPLVQKHLVPWETQQLFHLLCKGLSQQGNGDVRRKPETASDGTSETMTSASCWPGHDQASCPWAWGHPWPQASPRSPPLPAEGNLERRRWCHRSLDTVEPL